jgi:hypothetical protein
VTTPPIAIITFAPSAAPAGVPRKLMASGISPWLSTDAAYLRLRHDGQADLWVRFSTTTNAASGFVDLHATLFSATGPIGKPVQAAFVYLSGLTLARANNWLKATISMTDVEFASVTSIRITDVTRLIPTAFGSASYTASDVAAVREPSGSITITGVLDGTLRSGGAHRELGARLQFVVLDPAGAPLGDFGTWVAPPVKGTRAFDHTPFSANSASIAPSFPAASWMPPGIIAAVDVFTVLN